MEEDLFCNNCDWTGDATMLVSKTESLDDKDFNYCPECGSNDIENIKKEKLGYRKRKCDNCSREYMADERNLKRGWGLTCSKSCAAYKREKSKKSYNAETVEANNIKRKNWRMSETPPCVVGGSGIVTGYTSEGYRIMDGVAYNEWDEAMYNVDDYY